MPSYNYNLTDLNKLVDLGYIRTSEKNGLILYNYTDKCTFDRYWNDLTRSARGLILDKNTGEVIAKCLPKFFNLGEMEETFLTNLPKLPYIVQEKYDGSLGIIFKYNGSWSVSTRGSFYSDQAVMAQQMLKKYDLMSIDKDITLLVEIIYPENKIIVDYGQENKLVLLASFVRTAEHVELGSAGLKIISEATGIPLAKQYDLTIEQMIELQKTMPKDEEGFVVRFENGLRVKFKGAEYLRIAKLMSSLSPIALWETMKKGKVDQFYLQQLPEELRKDYEPVVEELEKQYSETLLEIVMDILDHRLTNIGDDWRKNTGLYLKKNKVKHSGAIFPFLLKKNDEVERYVMKHIRPDGNSLRTEL